MYNVSSVKEVIDLVLRLGIMGIIIKVGGIEYNVGVGLFFIKSIVKVSCDFFFIYSGNIFFKLLKINFNNDVELFVDFKLDNVNFKLM